MRCKKKEKKKAAVKKGMGEKGGQNYGNVGKKTRKTGRQEDRTIEIRLIPVILSYVRHEAEKA
jgi:hypothetical protein